MDIWSASERTDPQKPMRVEPSIYPMNGGDEKFSCYYCFALTYFLVSGDWAFDSCKSFIASSPETVFHSSKIRFR